MCIGQTNTVLTALNPDGQLKLDEMKTIKNRNNNGRPTLSAVDKKSYRTTVKFNPAEYYLLKAKAKSAGVNLSEMIRLSLKDCVIKERLRKEHTTMILQLTGMGNNLNQLTKKTHQAGFYTVCFECERLVKEIDNLIKQIAYDG